MKLKKIAPHALAFEAASLKKGKTILKITIQKGDKAELGGSGQPTERDELCERQDQWVTEKEKHSYMFSLFIPENFPIVPVRLVLAQWKQYAPSKNTSIDLPLIALRYVKEKLFITLQNQEKKLILWETQENLRGQWLSFTFHITFDREKGFFQAWLNNKQLCTYQGINAYNEEQGYPPQGKFYFKMGLYRDSMQEPMTIYFNHFEKHRLEELS